MASSTQTPRTVGILIFDEVEILDFCGPYEVFSVTRLDDHSPFNVITIAEKFTVRARNGLSVNPDFTLDTAPKLDLLLIPGGQGTRREMNNQVIIEWIQERAKHAELVLSVCTGALLLAKGNLLNGLKATTHRGAIELLRELAPHTEILADQRFLDNGKLIVSAGISAGIDMSLYVVRRLLGAEVASATANHMEYDWTPAASQHPDHNSDQTT